MTTDIKEALLLLVQKQQGNWAAVQQEIEPKLLEKFITLRYIRHVKDKWQITSEGIRQSLFYREPTEEECEQGKQMQKLNCL